MPKDPFRTPRLTGWSGDFNEGSIVVTVAGVSERVTRKRARRWVLRNVDVPMKIVGERSAEMYLENSPLNDYSYEFETVEEGV